MLAPGWIDKEVPISEGSPITRTERFQETYKNVSQGIRDQLNTEAEAVQIILTGIDNDIYSTVDACPNACEMWKAIERLKQGESINVQDLETNLYWEFGKFTSQDGENEEINHFGHEKHPLKLINWEMIRGTMKGDDDDENSKGVVGCDMCEEPLSIGDSAYACIQCQYDSIKEEASIKFQHEGHPQHTLTLQLRPAAFRCDACKTEEKGLFYECDRSQDDKGTTEINHWSHPAHPLILNVEDPQGNNKMPDINSGDPIKTHGKMRSSINAMAVTAMATQPSNMNPTTILLPNLLIPKFSVRYCKGHEIPLTYPPVEDHPEDFYCDICEEEMDPNLPLYHCQNCKYRNSFHPGCISRIDYYTNVWYGSTRTRSYHKHPLTFARRQKTPKRYGDIRGSKKLKGCGIVLIN
nr:hypothetical protein [Tanacetum cinerariifolium]